MLIQVWKFIMLVIPGPNLSDFFPDFLKLYKNNLFDEQRIIKLTISFFTSSFHFKYSHCVIILQYHFKVTLLELVHPGIHNLT